MKKLSLLIAVLLISSVEARAQNIFRIQAPIQPTCKIAWTHPGLDLNGNPTEITKFAMQLNGTNKFDLINVVSPNPKEYEIPCPAFIIGNTILVIYTYNMTLSGLTESGPSPEIQIIVDPPIPVKVAPRPPTNVKVVGN